MKIMKKLSYLILLSVIVISCGKQGKTESDAVDSTAVANSEELVNKRVFFKSPMEGDTVPASFQIVMGVEGMEVEPAGMVNEGKGHHHLVIDGSYIEQGTVVPADSTHIHFGKGQTEVDVTLTPGTHTLTLQFADGVHVSYGEKMSTTINVVVKED